MKRSAGLDPARIQFAADGTPLAPDYGDVYHSAAGGLGQARHVFLAGNGLPGRWAGRECFVIGETGFGLGTNFLATWQAWRDDPQRPARLHYVAIEKHPATVADLAMAHSAWDELAPLSKQLRDVWPLATAGFHRRHFEQGQLTLTLIWGDARHAAAQIDGRIDAFYLDGFAPDRNPELWAPELLNDLAFLANPDATCATYTVARPVRDALVTAGFTVEKRPGYGGKRDMLQGRIAAARPRPPSVSRGPVAVIGAGIAGVCVAERLARRGRDVILLEAAGTTCQGASGNRAAVMLPVLALEETRLARLNRAAFFYALHRLHALDAEGHAVRWSPCGVLQMPKSPELAARHRRVVTEGGLPTEFVQLLDREAASEIAGTSVTDGGWWFPQAGWVSPASLSKALLTAAGARLRLLTGRQVAEVTPGESGWRLLDADGGALAECATVILAQAHGITALPMAAHLPLRRFRGQVTHLPAAGDEAPRCVVCRDGYATPPDAGWRSVGASFERGDSVDLRESDHAANLARLSAMLPELAATPPELSGRAGVRPVSPDKLPMVGALPRPDCQPRPAAHVEWPRWPGVHVATGYGARGLVWAPLMAELLASQLCGEPLPVEAELAAAVDPARYAWKGTI